MLKVNLFTVLAAAHSIYVQSRKVDSIVMHTDGRRGLRHGTMEFGPFTNQVVDFVSGTVMPRNSHHEQVHIRLEMSRPMNEEDVVRLAAAMGHELPPQV